MRRYILTGFVLCALAFAGCSSGIRMTSSWNSTGKTKPQIKKILVIGLFGEKSRALRQEMEEQMASNLGKLGYEATAAYQEFGPKVFVNISEDHAMRLVDSSYGAGYDGVIVVSIIDKNSTKSYVPGYYSPSPYYGYGWGYNPYYAPYYRPYSLGYVRTNTHYSFETNLYDITGKKMIYSGQSDVTNPGGPNVLAIDYSRVILKDMRKKNVLS